MFAWANVNIIKTILGHIESSVFIIATKYPLEKLFKFPTLPINADPIIPLISTQVQMDKQN